MAKSDKKNTKASITTKKRRKMDKSYSKKAEYVQNLLELHKLQGVILAKLSAQM